MTGKHEKAGEIQDPGLLTKDELAAIQMTGALHELIATRVIGNGPAKWGDHAELTSAIHHIQYMVMAQAAARAYPEYFRLLGEGIAVDEEAEAEKIKAKEDIDRVLGIMNKHAE